MCETGNSHSVDIQDQGLVGYVEKHGSLFFDIWKEPAAFVFII
jgi:hypothetical protein